jgi:hypothetical protein
VLSALGVFFLTFDAVIKVLRLERQEGFGQERGGER